MAEVILFVNAGTSFVFAVNSYNFAPSSFFGSFFVFFVFVLHKKGETTVRQVLMLGLRLCLP